MTCDVEYLQRRLKGVGGGVREEFLMSLVHALLTDGNIVAQLSTELKVKDESSQRNVLDEEHRKFTFDVHNFGILYKALICECRFFDGCVNWILYTLNWRSTPFDAAEPIVPSSDDDEMNSNADDLNSMFWKPHRKVFFL